LQYPEQFRLGGKGNVPDLIKKQCAAIGLLKTADTGFYGPGKRAFLLAEKFALQQGLGKGGAINP
jgi:hypothetical protein